MSWHRYGFAPYVPVAQRRANAAKQVAKLSKKGRKVTPVKIEGTKIARTFWGKAWCDNMENYSDYSNRLPRGRTYVRNGSVVDLQISAGRVSALVAGSHLYEIDIRIQQCADAHWKRIRSQCAGQIGSLIELLQGKLSAGVMQIIAGADSGLFPKPNEIKLSCSCPDGAYLCKHVAATLYGVAARLDDQPELLFTLRKVDHLELIAQAGDVKDLVKRAPTQGRKTLGDDELADVFGINLAPAGPAPAPQKEPSTARAGARKGTSRQPNVATKLTKTPAPPADQPPAGNRKASARRPRRD